MPLRDSGGEAASRASREGAGGVLGAALPSAPLSPSLSSPAALLSCVSSAQPRIHAEAFQQGAGRTSTLEKRER